MGKRRVQLKEDQKLKIRVRRGRTEAQQSGVDREAAQGSTGMRGIREQPGALHEPELRRQYKQFSTTFEFWHRGLYSQLHKQYSRAIQTSQRSMTYIFNARNATFLVCRDTSSV
jgi:hypothetical protein